VSFATDGRRCVSAPAGTTSHRVSATNVALLQLFARAPETGYPDACATRLQVLQFIAASPPEHHGGAAPARCPGSVGERPPLCRHQDRPGDVTGPATSLRQWALHIAIAAATVGASTSATRCPRGPTATWDAHGLCPSRGGNRCHMRQELPACICLHRVRLDRHPLNAAQH